MIKPFLGNDGEAPSLFAPFADMSVRRHIFDAATSPENIIPLLDDCVSRVLQDRTFKPRSWHAGEVNGSAIPELIARLLFVNVENAPAAARYGNGDWSQIDTILPIVDRMIRTSVGHRTSWESSSISANGRAGPIRFPELHLRGSRMLDECPALAYRSGSTQCLT